MKRMRWVVMLLSAVCCAPSSETSGASSRSDRATYAATLDQVWETLSQSYFDPTFGGMSWEGLRDRYRDRIIAAESDSVFYVTLNEMLFELGVSHLGVIPRDHPEWIGAPSVFADGDVGVDVRLLEDAIVVVDVDPGSPAEEAGLRAGCVVSSIDDATLEAIREDALMPPNPPIDERLRVVQAVQEKLYGAAGAEVALTFVDLPGAEHRVTLTRRRRPGRVEIVEGLPPAFLEFEGRWIGEDLGYIRFNSFHPALLDTILEAIDAMREADGIIFDLRGNPGGVFPVRRAIVEHLIRERGVIWRYEHRNETRNVVLAPVPNGYAGAVAIVTDVLSASSAEEFAGALQAIGRAVVIGERTPGIVLTAEVVELPIGASLVYPNARTLTADGMAFEGRGVIPDVPVELRRTDLAAGHDTQIDAAVRRLRGAR